MFYRSKTTEAQASVIQKCWFSGPYSHFSENRVNKCILKKTVKYKIPNSIKGLNSLKINFQQR